jgi:hypothetical protein
LRPFAETSAGLAHISSQVYSLSGVALLPDGEARNTVPLASLAAGVQLHLGRRFTVDGGYRAQRFFSDADATRRNHYMALGVRF